MKLSEDGFGYTTKDNIKALPYYSYFENDFPDVKQVTERLVTCLINDLSDLKLSANWMAPAGHAGEDAAMFETVKAFDTKGYS